MQIMYNTKNYNYQQPRYTFGKIYDVIADYTKRESLQAVNDNGYVIKDDLGENSMVFKNDVIIVDSTKGNTHIFDYKIEGGMKHD